jgi:hypothetical protein
MSSESNLALRLTVPQLVEAYEKASNNLREAFRLVASVEDNLSATFSMGELRMQVYDERNRSMDWRNPDRVLTVLDQQIWRSIVDRLGLRQLMSVTAAERLDKQIDNHEMPPITESAVRTVLEGFAGNLDKMLQQAVEETYDWLRPRAIQTHAGRYKTNQKHAIDGLGERIVLTSVLESGRYRVAKFAVSCYYQARFTALENVFTSLDGKGQITKTFYSALSNAILESNDTGGKGETEYFEFRAFLNGNLHLRFKRADLVAKFNKLAGSKTLKGQ